MKLIKNGDFQVFDAESAKNDNVVGRKLKEARLAEGLTLVEESIRLKDYGVDVSNRAVSKWENGATVPNAYQLTALCCLLGIDDPVQRFSDREALNFEGLKKLAEYRSDLISSGKYRVERQEPEIIYINMPVSTLGASAGTGNFLDDENFEMASFPRSSVPAGANFGIRIVGDSMEPLYNDGQLVWIKQSLEIAQGEIGLFVLDGNGYIKMYGEQTPECPDDYTDSSGVMHLQPVLISINRKYSPIPVTRGKYLKIVGKVL